MASHLFLLLSITSATEAAAFGENETAEGLKAVTEEVDDTEILLCGRADAKIEWDRVARLNRELRKRDWRPTMHFMAIEQLSSSKNEI